jgi:transcriptional regulator with XRE-family HTH domain
VANKKDIEILTAFGIHLRKLIESKGFSLRGLADEADIEYSQIARIVSGTISPKVTTVYKIAEALNVSMKELFDFKYSHLG